MDMCDVLNYAYLTGAYSSETFVKLLCLKQVKQLSAKNLVLRHRVRHSDRGPWVGGNFIQAPGSWPLGGGIFIQATRDLGLGWGHLHSSNSERGLRVGATSSKFSSFLSSINVMFQTSPINWFLFYPCCVGIHKDFKQGFTMFIGVKMMVSHLCKVVIKPSSACSCHRHYVPQVIVMFLNWYQTRFKTG